MYLSQGMRHANVFVVHPGLEMMRVEPVPIGTTAEQVEEAFDNCQGMRGRKCGAIAAIESGVHLKPEALEHVGVGLEYGMVE